MPFYKTADDEPVTTSKEQSADKVFLDPNVPVAPGPFNAEQMAAILRHVHGYGTPVDHDVYHYGYFYLIQSAGVSYRTTYVITGSWLDYQNRLARFVAKVFYDGDTLLHSRIIEGAEHMPFVLKQLC
jgi:hypothetical protein